VLNLRISQYRNPEQFNEIFGNDFRTARGLISSNPRKAYIDLQDLEAINPDFPGLQAAITEAEYAAGIRVRPPDPQKLQRSRELYQLALGIVNRNVRSEFNVALSYLDEAINLNPDNLDAIRLKDRISSDIGGTATAVMSSADQQLYQEAVREFTAGNYLRARIIVENLLKDPDNQRNTRLIELKERIERTR
jgi:tetratricopeptide (TPR) repeat protein